MNELTSFCYRRITDDDYVNVVGFIDEQVKTIAKDYFFAPSLEILEKCLSEDLGISIGLFDREELVGVRLTYQPMLDKANHGYDLGYGNHELYEVAQFHGTLVVNDKRYKGIGNNLVKINCEQVFLKGFGRILATVHPENSGSIKMLENNGFSKQLLTYKYNNLPRWIFEKLKPK